MWHFNSKSLRRLLVGVYSAQAVKMNPLRQGHNISEIPRNNLYFPIILPLILLPLGQGPSRQNADFCGWCSCHTSHSCSRHKPVSKFSFLVVICILCEFRPKFSRFGLASFGSHHTFWCGNKNGSLKTKSE